tara:strand:- start:6511 stop:6918 length:408 start_codon:yes stop_codon:yes gene_type:complete
MFSKDSNNKETYSSESSVIGTEMQINGNIKCQGSLVIKGTVKGNIECDVISLSSEGVLKGSIKSKDSEISGKFEGNIFSDTIAIGSTASIKGGIHYNNMQAEPGAKLEADFILGLEEKKITKKPSLAKSIKTIKG